MAKIVLPSYLPNEILSHLGLFPKFIRGRSEDLGKCRKNVKIICFFDISWDIFLEDYSQNLGGGEVKIWRSVGKMSKLCVF